MSTIWNRAAFGPVLMHELVKLVLTSLQRERSAPNEAARNPREIAQNVSPGTESVVGVGMPSSSFEPPPLVKCCTPATSTFMRAWMCPLMYAVTCAHAQAHSAYKGTQCSRA